MLKCNRTQTWTFVGTLGNISSESPTSGANSFIHSESSPSHRIHAWCYLPTFDIKLMVNLGKPHKKTWIQKGHVPSSHFFSVSRNLCNQCFGSIVVQPFPSLWRCSLEPDERCFRLGITLQGSESDNIPPYRKRKIIETQKCQKVFGIGDVLVPKGG